jgi:ABC-type amino acid transport substrate-binding protein
MSTSGEWSLKRYREVAIVAFKGPTEGLLALEVRDIDVYFGDRALLAEMIGKANYPARLMIASKLFYL